MASAARRSNEARSTRLQASRQRLAEALALHPAQGAEGTQEGRSEQASPQADGRRAVRQHLRDLEPGLHRGLLPCRHGEQRDVALVAVHAAAPGLRDRGQMQPFGEAHRPVVVGMGRRRRREDEAPARPEHALDFAERTAASGRMWARTPLASTRSKQAEPNGSPWRRAARARSRDPAAPPPRRAGGGRSPRRPPASRSRRPRAASGGTCHRCSRGRGRAARAASPSVWYARSSKAFE